VSEAWVKRVAIPFSRQIRSNRTSAGYGFVYRPVNCFPLSVNTSDGAPYRAMASMKASQTERIEGSVTTVAITTNRA
jgi:hypothetical protein